MVKCSVDSDINCPNAGLWPYVFTVLYFVHLKLFLLNALFAVFSNTLADVDPVSDMIWKFQRYELVVDFAMRRCLPPPLNAITCVWLLLTGIFSLRTILFKKKRDRHQQVKAVSTMKGQKLSERDYHYWKQKALEYSNNADSANENTLDKNYEKYVERKFNLR
ncbi:hypothetical protein MTO96_047403 [Rhipicephalus appendiculatus]